MKIIHSILIMVLLAISYSCGDDTAIDKLNDIKSDASNFEDGVSTAMEYNDGVISEISLLDLKMMGLNEQAEKGLDETYPSLYEDCLKEYARVSSVIHKVSPAGVGGVDFKLAATNYIESYGEMLEYFNPESIARILEIINNEQAQSSEFLEYTESFFSAMEKVDEAFDQLSSAQQIFATKNDSKIKEDNIDLEELYEESK